MTDKQKKQGVVIALLLLLLYYLFGRKKGAEQSITFAKAEPIKTPSPAVSTPPFVGGGGSFGGGGSSGTWSNLSAASNKISAAVQIPLISSLGLKQSGPTITPILEKKSAVMTVSPLKGSGILPTSKIQIPSIKGIPTIQALY